MLFGLSIEDKTQQKVMLGTETHLFLYILLKYPEMVTVLREGNTTLT